MKTLGIVGGIAPESTVDYYRSLLAAYRRRRPDGSAPAIVINSIDLKKMLDLVAAGRLDDLTAYLAAEIERLARAGAAFALLASNTPHLVFDRLQSGSSIPLLSIVQAACDATRRTGRKRLGLFGTRFTMQGSFYPQVFSAAGIALVAPAAADLEFIHEKYMGELVNGVFLPETRAALLAIVERMRTGQGIDGVVLAGTELPLLLRDAAVAGVPFLDTTQIHVEAAIDRMLS